MGYQILAVTPDRPKKLLESIKKHTLKYQLLSDSSMRASKAFGVAWQVPGKIRSKYKGYGIDLEDASGKKHHLIPVPATFLVDQKGIIRFKYVNPDHRICVNTDVLFAAAKSIAK